MEKKLPSYYYFYGLFCKGCLCFVMIVSLSGFAQSKEKLYSFKWKNTSILNAFKQIEAEAKVHFSYNPLDLNVNQKIDLNVEKVRIGEVLNAISRQVSIKYQINGSTIMIQSITPQPVVASVEFTLTGKVTDENKMPMPGVIVVNVTKNKTVTTNAQGDFSIQADKGDLVRFRMMGFQQAAIVVSDQQKSVTIILNEESLDLKETVITALGIKREEKSLGYAISKIDGEEISKTAPTNWVNALSGKVPGLNITKAGAGPGGSVRITLRGQNSLDLGKGEPLIVIDGVPVTSGMISNDGQSYGATGNTETPIDYGNALSEINPDDIKDVTILRGPSAAALYGSRAGAGAILITTKTNTDKKENFAVAFNSNVTFDDVLHYPDFQFEYGAGNTINTYFSYGASPDGPTTNSTRSFGPAFAGQSYFQYDPLTKTTGTTRTPWVADKNYVSDAFRTGVTYNNTLSLTGGDARNSIRLSYNDMRNEYILPNTGYTQNRLSFSSNSKLNNFTLSTRINYYHKGSANLPLSGYNTNSFMYGLMYGSANIPFGWHENYWDIEGIDQNNKLNPSVDNPYFILYENLNTLNQDRIFGNITATYNLTKKMNLMLRGGLDQSSSFRTNRRPYSSIRYAAGRYQEQQVTMKEQNYDFLYRYEEKLSQNIGLSFSAGASITQQESNNNTTLAERLSYPAIYTLANAKDRPLVMPERFRKEVQSVYGLSQFNYKTYLFLDLTARNDWSSTLPKANNSYFYYSVQGSAVLTEMFNLSKIKPLSYLKIRGSLAQVGNDTDPYRTALYLSNSAFGGSYSSPRTLPGGQNLKPEIITNREVGADIRFFGSRLGFDLTYYNSNSSKQILEVPNDPATGYAYRIFNAGLINNSGYEVAINGSPLSKKNKLQWKTIFTYSANKSKIKELAPGVESIIMATGPRGYIEARVGGSIGDIYGSGYVRSPDGQIVYDNNGLPLIDTENFKYLGSAVPDFKAGIQNQFTYSRFSLSFLFDGQKGGNIYSFSNSVLAGAGKLTSTLDGRYGGIVGEGVVQNADGTYIKNDIVANPGAYYNRKYLRDNVEANTFDASYIKLREVTLEYKFTAKLLKNIGAKSASFSVYGRDLLLFTSFPLYDPEIATLNRNRIEPGFETGQFPSTRSIGATIKASF